MGFGEAIRSGFSNYVGFSGRAPRSEYWYWTLFVILVSIVASILDVAIFPFHQLSPLSTIASIVLLLPGIAVGARRLHDMDHTGWWLLIMLTGIGAFVLLIWFCFRGTEGPNRFGPDPLAGRGLSPLGST
jgi:uncharacterized membrane protein YhaH (DUF805 family)